MARAGRTLLQRTSDEAVMARVFAVQEGTSLLGVALGAGLMALVVRATSEVHGDVGGLLGALRRAGM